jgi:hypothetical protein
MKGETVIIGSVQSLKIIMWRTGEEKERNHREGDEEEEKEEGEERKRRK